MQIKAEAKYLPISPRKVRLVADLIRKKSVSESLVLLENIPKRGAGFLRKAICSALANAVNNFNLKKEDLIVSRLLVDGGPTIKRMDKSHGARFDRGIIRKRTSHIKVILEERKKIRNPKLKVKN